MSTSQAQGISAGIQLRDILPDSKAVGPTDVVIKSACGKWSECQPGDIFVAIADAETDGHNFVSDAISKGATAIVGERLLPVSVPQFIVEDSRIAYGKICHALAGSPSNRIGTIGISGSVGKSVTSHLIYAILKKSGLESGLSSSIETRFADTTEPAQLATTAPLLANQLAKMAISNCSHAVMETSSIALAQHALSGMQLDAAILTNIQRCNLGFHQNFSNYQRAEARLLDYLKPSGFAVVNADDKNAIKLLDDLDVPALTFGIHNYAEVSAKLLDRNCSFQTFLLTAGNETVVVRTATIGKQHIYNCLAATAVSLTFGIDLETIAQGLEFAQTPGRLERIDCGQGFGVWVDSSLSPNQLNGAIAAVAPLCEGKLWCVGSTDHSQTPEERKQIGSILERKTEKPIITQSKSTTQIDYEPSHQVIDGFEDPSSAHVMPDRIKAIEWALSQAGEKDIVLISGAGERPIATVGDEQWSVTDKDVCTAFLTNGSKGGQVGHFPTIVDIYNIDDYR